MEIFSSVTSVVVYTVKDNTKTPSQGNFSFDSLAHSVEEGSTLSLAVNREGGASEQVSVSWEVIMGALDSSDMIISEGTLSWDDGDVASKSIELQILSDTVVEINESFMVRLYDPKNGAALGQHNMAMISVTDKVNTQIEIDAGSDQIVSAGEIVQLQGAITGASNTQIDFEWVQNSGKAVQLAQDGDGSAEFIAPTSPGSLQFTLTASLPTGELYSDQTTVTVIVDNVTESSGGGGCVISTNSSNQSILLLLMVILSVLFLISKKYAYIRIVKK